MAYDYDRIITDCRAIDLDNPDFSAPNDDAMFGKAIDVAQLRHNQAQNSSVAWSIRFWDLKVSPGKPEYLVPFGEAFGKPLRIHTIDPTHRFHHTRKVTVVDPQNVDEYYYRGPMESRIGAAHHFHSAVVFQFYYKFGQPYLKPEPTPGETSVYRVWFETGAIPEPALADGLPVPESFHRYLRISTSIAIISQCLWTRLLGDNPNAIDPERQLRIMREKRRDLLDGLLKQEVEYRKEYEDFIATSHQAGVNEPNPYGGWLTDDYYY